MDTWGIVELERLTGVGRSTIYYYQREGLLPPMHRKGGRPAAYGSRHVAAIEQIRLLKDQGLTIGEIKAEIDRSGLNSAPEGRDLVAEQREGTRASIVSAATRQFAARGYKETHVVDIVAEVGIATNTFYDYFPGKRELFIEVVERLIVGSLETVEPEILREPDFIKRNLLRASGFLSLRDISPGMLAFVRAEYMSPDEQTRSLFIRLNYALTRNQIEDLGVLRRASSSPPPFPDEMMAFAIYGGAESAAMRLSWDDSYGVEDYLWTILEFFLSLRAAYGGPPNSAEEREKYRSLVEELALHPPYVFSGSGGASAPDTSASPATRPIATPAKKMSVSGRGGSS